MPSIRHSPLQLIPPNFIEASQQALNLDSTLGELPLCQFQVESFHLGTDVARIFEEYPAVPGVIVVEDRQFVSMISRQRLLEYLLRPHGLELFLSHPLSVLHSYARVKNLVLPESTPILLAAQQALRRSRCQQGEPIVVCRVPQTYYLLDAHELNIAHWQIRGIETQVRFERAQAEMLRTEKMASLGRLVDGVAHEILDPVGFIWGNLSHISTYSDQLMELLSAYHALLPEIPPALAQLQDDLELDYLRQDFPRAINSIRTGAERLKKLVLSLQNFCHIDEVYPKPADLHECLDQILLLLKSRLTGEIQIHKQYGHLPPVTCYVGQLSQVFMNILTNAVDGLLEQAIRQDLDTEFALERGTTLFPEELSPLQSPLSKPQITITTQVKFLPSEREEAIAPSRWVSITITDNGPGLSPQQYRQIQESLSIEKRAAKETSLSVSYQIVTAKHGGKFHIRSPILPLDTPDETHCNESVKGTEVEILLPLT